MLKEVEVISPVKIKEYTFDAIYISSEKHYEEIRQELESDWKIDSDVIKHFEMKKMRMAIFLTIKRYLP